MPVLSYTEGNIPTSEQFSKELADAIKRSNPVDDLVELVDALQEFEQEYGLDSADFYQKYQAGQLDDELQHCMEWAALYDTYLRTRKVLKLALMRSAAVIRELELAA